MQMNPTSQLSPLTADSAAPSSDSRYDRQLAKILEHATAIFYEKGYEGASIRDLSRASGMSLAGLYYYFESKEKRAIPNNASGSSFSRISNTF
jgi:hypothetical protein